MIYIKPSFYNKFKCIDSRCTDNCCVGWEVDVDESTLAYYKTVEGDFGKELCNGLTTAEDGSNCFKLCDGERCIFLNESNLCKIIMNCGENALCDICGEHPRFYEWFPGVTECGLGLCCEEACRLLLEEGFSLCEENDGKDINLENKEDIIESDRYVYFSAFRERLFDILFSELTFEEKLLKLISATEEFAEKSFPKQYMKDIVSKYKNTEPINEQWTMFINRVSEDFSELNTMRAVLFEQYNKAYSNVLAYLLYRHFIKAVFDDAVMERVVFCVNAINMITFFDAKTLKEKGEITTTDRINNVKLWSKQIEYSEENTDFLIFGSVEYGQKS